jgi:hypothetical protein
MLNRWTETLKGAFNHPIPSLSSNQQGIPQRDPTHRIHDAIPSGRHSFLSHSPIPDMTEVNEHAVEALLNRGYDVSLREFVHLVERHHPTEQQGVSRETLAAYADAVAEEDDALDPDDLLDSIDERFTDIEVWTEELYEVGEGRVSAHTSEWHDDSALSEQVLEVVGTERRTLLPREVVKFIERYHPHDQPGIAWSVLEAYAMRLADDLGDEFDQNTFLEEIDDRLVDTATWYGDDALYELDTKRVSLFPLRWHDSLGGSTDLTAYVRFLTDEAPGFSDERAAVGGAGEGVPEQFLLDTVNLVGRVDRATVKSRLEDLRDRGELVEDADQHPNARVQLAEQSDKGQDSSLQGSFPL